MKALMQRLGWLYRSMYYRFYRYSEKADSAYSMYYLNAAINFSMILIVNFGFLLVAYASFFPETSILDSLPIWVVGAMGALFCVAHALFLGYKGRYKKILNEFSKESREEEHRRNLWAVWYVVVSLFSFIGLSVCGVMLK